jgi:hypothetical protein
MKGDGTSFVEVNGGKPKVRIPRTRLGDTRDGVCAGVAAAEPEPAGVERQSNGRFAKGSAKLGRIGGRAKKNAAALAKDLGLEGLVKRPEFKPYLRRSQRLGRAIIADLAQHGGGHVGATAGHFVQSGCLATAASRFEFAAGNFLAASKLADSARSHFLAARHLVGQDALGRKRGGPMLPALDAATEAALDAEVERLVAAHGKSATREGERAEHMVTGNNEVTAKQLETEGDDSP